MSGEGDMDQIRTGKFIRRLRTERGWTQSAFAGRLGVSEKTVSKWETGRGLPEVSLMLPVCELLGITVNELLASGWKGRRTANGRRSAFCSPATAPAPRPRSSSAMPRAG